MTPLLKSTFGLAFCINLTRRPERWAAASLEFQKAGLDVRRFEAFDGETYPSHLVPDSPALRWPLSPGPYCSLLSHLSVVSFAKNADLPAVMIFEDDLWLDTHFCTKAEHFLREVPEDWDMIYWNGKTMLDKAVISPLVMRPSYVYNCFAYCVSARAYDRVIAALRTKKHWADQLMAGLHPQMSVYMPRAPFAWQRNDLDSDNKDKKRELDSPAQHTTLALQRKSLSRKGGR